MVELRRLNRRLNNTYSSDRGTAVDLDGSKEMRVNREQLRQPGNYQQQECGSLECQTHRLIILV